jgi:hypothetical protein
LARKLSKHDERNPDDWVFFTFASTILPSFWAASRALWRRANDLAGSTSKKIAVNMTAMIWYISCSVKIPWGCFSVLRGSEKMLEAK